MKRTYDEIREAVTKIIGDRTDDEALALLEDLADSAPDGEDWELKYRENDEMWRKKYRDRFEGKLKETKTEEKTDEEVETETEGKEETLDDYFKEEK